MLAGALPLLACQAVFSGSVSTRAVDASLAGPAEAVTVTGHSKAVPAKQTSSATAGDISRILAYFPVENTARTIPDCRPDDAGQTFLTRRFSLQGRCKTLDDDARECAYKDYRDLDLDPITGFDQRDVFSHQVTFPGTEHLWAALSVRNKPGSRFCWVGGAHIGQNPLTMTWGGETGTKKRKNNFILSQSGHIEVDSARIHNLHDVFLADNAAAGFSVNRSWITWNRDDIFEGYLHDLSFRNTLIDGTYTFISDPDGDCDADKKAGDRTIVIENSLIRLQRQPGPFSRHTGKWDWAVEGGHNTLWKLDSCDWDEWPSFILKNNVFLIEGPRTTFRQLNTVDCRLALPGDCADPTLSQLRECHNNLFLYTDYHHWREAGKQPGPVPSAASRFYNAGNPDYLPNGRDCYQRLTDDGVGPGTADIDAIWMALRDRWIDWHTDSATVQTPLMRIPGVDFPVFPAGSTIRLINRESGQCMAMHSTKGVHMQECSDSQQQLFTVSTFHDGKLAAALLLRNGESGFIRSEPAEILQARSTNLRFANIMEGEASESGPGFDERWYISPLPETPETRGWFYIETDAVQRSFLRQTGNDVHFQALFADGPDTALPHARFDNGNDHRLQWEIHLVIRHQK